MSNRRNFSEQLRRDFLAKVEASAGEVAELELAPAALSTADEFHA